MKNWDRVLKPIVVLCVICIVVTGALATTNQATAPVIAAAKAAAEDAARRELLPDAEEFVRVEGVDAANVTDIYNTSNNVGIVITSTGKGYGGDMTVMTAFTADGTIKQLKVTEAGETKGIGSNVSENSAYWENYVGLAAEKELVLGTDVDAYTGATMSSRGLNAAVNAAINAYVQSQAASNS